MEPEYWAVKLGAPCTDRVGSDRDFGSLTAGISNFATSGSPRRARKDCFLGRCQCVDSVAKVGR